MEYQMVVLDNSDWSRNGDYVPSRWEAQVDSTFLIANTKLAANQESALGLITMAGQSPQVLLTPTNEDLKIQASLYGVKQQGKTHFKNALSIAYLALKHRKNAHARQRITVFVASPISEDENTLVKFAKTLKKNSVAVDLINIGQMDKSHIQKLEKFIETVNQGDNSHFLNIEPGLGRMEDKLIGTPFVGAENNMFQDIGGAQGGAAADVNQINNQFAEWGGINPQEDPEMAEIMRQSLLTAEYEKKKQEEQNQQQQNNNKMEEEEQKKDGENQNEDSNKQDKLEADLIKRAEEITQDKSLNDKKQEEPEIEGEIQDKNFVNSLIDLIPGINKDDPELKKALDGSSNDNNDKKDEDKDKKDGDNK